MGTVSEMSTSRLAAPTVASIFSMSSGPGPMWRSANRSLGLGISLLRLSALPRCRHLQRCLNRTVHVPESFRGGVAPSAPRDLGALPFGVDGNPHDTTIATGRWRCLIGNWPPVLCRPARSVSDRCQPQQPGASARRATPMRQAEHRSRRPSSGGTARGSGTPTGAPPFSGHTLKRNSTTSSGRIR